MLPNRSPLKIELYNILDSNRNSRFYMTQLEIYSVEQFLTIHLGEININGYEVFIGSKIFTENISFIKDITLYYYSVYNYWYNTFEHELRSGNIQKIINGYANKIGAYNFENIFTTNFDKYFDEYFSIKHIHGMFVERYSDVEEMHVEYYTKNQFDDENHYTKIAVGTNGLEKANGLMQLKKTGYAGYDYSFLYDENLAVGNLLIFGMRFADSMIVPNQVMEKYSLNDIDLIKYVDGHIMLRLDALLETNKLSGVTIACYSTQDKERYERVFSKRKISGIIKYIDCRKVF
ncbi:MAG: hypothetical protein R3Y54_13060 [Eubacteriales bacterium]